MTFTDRVSSACLASLATFFLATSLTSCGPESYLQPKKAPTAEERQLRAAFVSGTNLDPVLDRQLIAFEITPEDAMRRQAYVDSHPRLSRRVRGLLLSGQFVLNMTLAQVEASWGRAEFTEDVSVAEHTRIRWRYTRPAGAYNPRPIETNLTFEDGRLIDIREHSR
jgi:hypothetical protein